VAGATRTWILTSSPANHAATEATGFSVIGLKERNRNRALQVEPGDRIVLYLTQVMSFAAAIRVTGELFEDRTPVWPGKPGKVDAYPWRFPTDPEVVLEEADWVAAEELRTALEHVRKWPEKHWRLAFQGQLRPVSAADGALLVDRLRAAAGVTA
jgi:EVE domain